MRGETLSRKGMVPHRRDQEVGKHNFEPYISPTPKKNYWEWSDEQIMHFEAFSGTTGCGSVLNLDLELVQDLLGADQ